VNHGATILPNIDVSYLDETLFDEKENLKILDAAAYDQYPQEHIALWCHHKGIYGLPTSELVDWLKPHIAPGKTIEIGAGNGALGRALGIPITDSRCMDLLEVRIYYALNGQPVTPYPDDIIAMDAVEAVQNYQPQVVVGSWVTHKYNENKHWRGGNMYGIDEDAILNQPCVIKYIVIGNTNIHGNKPIHDRKDFKKLIYSHPWIKSRSQSPEKNVIYYWERVV
jgi:hypothetical protein